MKQCKQCRAEKPLVEFHRASRGRLGRRAVCKQCQAPNLKNYRMTHPRPAEEQRERSRRRRLADPEGYRRAMRKGQRKWRSKRRELLITAKNRPCQDCGRVFPPYVMDFDHVRGEKLFELSQIYATHSKELEILSEIEKCDVVCANCHRIRTWSNRYGRGGFHPSREVALG